MTNGSPGDFRESVEITNLNENGKHFEYNNTRKLFVVVDKVRNVRRSIRWGRTLKVAVCVVFWYTTSMTLTAVNKTVFDSLGFNYPLLVTFFHMAVLSFGLRLGFACSRCFPDFPLAESTNYIRFIVPIALFSAMDVALSNAAYRLVSLSAMTVIKSSLCVVTYLMAVAAGLESFSWLLLGVVSMIALSICLTVPSLQIDSYVGVGILVAAVVCAGLRWVIVHHQLQRQSLRPLQLMMLTQPLAAIFLAFPAIGLDLRKLVNLYVLGEIHLPSLKIAAVLVSLSVILVFCLILAEFMLVDVTSSVSLTVAGVGKEVITIGMSMVLFGEELKIISGFGIAFSILGIILYARLRANMASDSEVTPKTPSIQLTFSEVESTRRTTKIP